MLTKKNTYPVQLGGEKKLTTQQECTTCCVLVWGRKLNLHIDIVNDFNIKSSLH